MKTLLALGLTLFIVLTIGSPVSAQTKFQLQSGFSYIEHFSLGAGCSFSDRHAVSILYGSNFLIDTKSFRTILLQYALHLKKPTNKKVIPVLGVKGGDVIFSDDYYRWHVASVIPFAEILYPMNDHIHLFLQGGCSFSFEQSVERIKEGEIGHYQDVLPEFKAGVIFNLRK